MWFAIAWPSCLTILGRLLMVLTDLAFLGHLSTDALAAASMANVSGGSAGGVVCVGCCGCPCQ